MAFDAYNSNVPPAIASSGGGSLEGPTSIPANLTSMPNPTAAAMNSAKFFAGAAPITNQIAVKYGLSISDQQNAGKTGPANAAQPTTGGAAPIMTHVNPRKIHSMIKEGLPSIGQLYKPSLGGPSLKVKKTK